VREQHDPAALRPLVEVDRAGRGVCLEVGRFAAEAQRLRTLGTHREGGIVDVRGCVGGDVGIVERFSWLCGFVALARVVFIITFNSQ